MCIRDRLACAERAAAAVMDTRAQGCGVRLTERIPANLHRIAQLPGTVESARKAQKVRDAYAAAKAYSPEIDVYKRQPLCCRYTS